MNEGSCNEEPVPVLKIDCINILMCSWHWLGLTADEHLSLLAVRLDRMHQCLHVARPKH
jgi:hypothetical protein